MDRVHVVQELRNAERARQYRDVGYVCDISHQLRARATWIASQHRHRSLGPDEPKYRTEHRRLAGAVRPEDAHDPARLELEVQIVDGDGLSERLAQSAR